MLPELFPDVLGEPGARFALGFERPLERQRDLAEQQVQLETIEKAQRARVQAPQSASSRQQPLPVAAPDRGAAERGEGVEDDARMLELPADRERLASRLLGGLRRLFDEVGGERGQNVSLLRPRAEL